MKLQPTPLIDALQAADLQWLGETEAELLGEMFYGYSTHRHSRGHVTQGIKTDLNTVLDFLRFAGGIPGQVTPGQFEAWSTHLFRDREIAASTQRKYQAAVRVFFDYLVREVRYRNRVRQVLGADIVQVSTPENSIIHRRTRELERTNERRAFTGEELDRFFEVLDEAIEIAFRTQSKGLRALQRDKAMFFVTYQLGLRADEVLGLRVTSFEPNPKFKELGAYGLARVFGKGQKWRTVTALSPLVVEFHSNLTRGVHRNLTHPEMRAV